MTFVRQVRGELRKLCAPYTLMLLVVFTAFVWSDASTTVEFSDLQTPIAVAVTLDNQRQLDENCANGIEEVVDDVDCEMLRQTVQLNKYFGSNGLALGSVAASLNTFPGLIKFTSHPMATGLGWLLVALLTALHVTREASAGTLAYSVLRTGRLRYLTTKATSLLAACFVFVTLSSVVLFALRSTFVRDIGAPRAPIGPDGAFAKAEEPVAASTEWTAWSAAAGDLLCCLLVLAVIIAAFVGIASLLRKTTAAGAVLVGVVAALIAASHVAAVARWLPIAKISEVLGLDQVPSGVRDARIWNLAGRAPDIYSLPPDSTASWLALVLWTLVFLAVALGTARLFTQRAWIG